MPSNLACSVDLRNVRLAVRYKLGVGSPRLGRDGAKRHLIESYASNALEDMYCFLVRWYLPLLT